MLTDPYRTVDNRSKACKISKLLVDVSYHSTLFICLTMFLASGDTVLQFTRVGGPSIPVPRFIGTHIDH